jgi:hypothetical protein
MYESMYNQLTLICKQKHPNKKLHIFLAHSSNQPFDRERRKELMVLLIDPAGSVGKRDSSSLGYGWTNLTETISDWNVLLASCTITKEV